MHAQDSRWRASPKEFVPSRIEKAPLTGLPAHGLTHQNTASLLLQQDCGFPPTMSSTNTEMEVLECDIGFKGVELPMLYCIDVELNG